MKHCRTTAFAALACATMIVVTTSSGCTSGGKPSLSYVGSIAEIKAGNVKNVTLSPDRAIVNLKAAPKNVDSSDLTFAVTIPTADSEKSELMELLESKGVQIEHAQQ